MSNPFLRLVCLVLLGAVLTPLSGYFAGIVFGKEIVILFVATLVGIFIDGAKATLTVLAIPAVFGIKWAWPVTCVVLPLAGLFIRGSERSPWQFGAIGAVAGAVTACAWIGLGLKPLQTEFWQYPAAGAVGCGCVGLIFGFVLRRIDRGRAAPAPIPPLA